ncbi:hypothetical protein OAJ57_03280 [Alphaproteobacteria bacterium]|nr:hypothetical protein [Alphaproteobacteria bacterium]
MGGNLIIRNTVAGYSTSYDIAIICAFGPLMDLEGGGNVSVVATTEHSHANFAY